MTRGLRLNNPGNIRISDTPWQGKVQPSRDPEFETFDTPEHGIRAVCRILLTCFEVHDLDTVAEIIDHWAPPNENNTSAYVGAVCEMTGFEAKEELDPTSATLAKLTSAIIFHENGLNPYSRSEIQQAANDVTGVTEYADESLEPATHNID